MERHWVSVGSFSSHKNAHRQLVEVKLHTEAEARIYNQRGSNEKEFYRVVVGPYAIKSDAHQERLKLQIQYADAWIWTEHDEDPDHRSSNIATPVQLEFLDPGREIDPQARYTIPRNSDKPEMDRKLVEEPPPGYGLHKLRREY